MPGALGGAAGDGAMPDALDGGVGDGAMPAAQGGLTGGGVDGGFNGGLNGGLNGGFSGRVPTMSASLPLPVASVAPVVASPMSARSPCPTPEPPFPAAQPRVSPVHRAPMSPDYRAPPSPEAALPVEPEGVQNGRRDGPLNPNDVHCPNVYSNAEHRHLDTLWLTREGCLPCCFHGNQCGVFGLSCPACGILHVCYPCRMHFIETFCSITVVARL